MSFAIFYILHDSRKRAFPDTEFLTKDGFRTGDAEYCSSCGGTISTLEWLPPFEVELQCYDRGFGDVVFGTGEELLVSERCRRLFEVRSLTGLRIIGEAQIVKVMRRKRFPDAPPRYFVARVDRTQAVVDQKASELVWGTPPTCDVCRIGRIGKRWERIVLEPGTWTGEDLFRPRGGGEIMASPRFKDFVNEHKITNLALVPAEDYEYDFYPWENTKRAEQLAQMALSDQLLERRKPNGEVLRYFIPRNEMLIISPDGNVRVSRPLDGANFFQKY